LKKSHIRDYATAAFQFYAVNGSSEKYKQKIWNEALWNKQQRELRGEGFGAPTESAVIHAEAALNEKMGEIADLEAVEKTIYDIEHMTGGRDIIKALKIVYMDQPQRDIERGEIRDRVHRAELSIPASERSVYGWLQKARKIFAEERGLRV
jgi:hypothetical protein